MPRAKKAATFELPQDLKIESINGEQFMKVRAAARLAGVHPAVLSMGQRLLKESGQGSYFKLADPKMVSNAAAIETSMLRDLKRVVRALAGKGHKAKSYLDYDQKRIVFWVE